MLKKVQGIWTEAVVGDVVRVEHRNTLLGCPGVVFALNNERDNEASSRSGDECFHITSVSVRWFNGREETFELDKTSDQHINLCVTTPCLFVNVYLDDQQYGGPEEGGWWYNTSDLIESIECESEKEAEKLLEEKQLWCKEENRGRPPISSVNSIGRYSVCLESHSGKDVPDRVPHYC